MNSTMELHTSEIRKRAWIDSVNRIVSFRQICDAACFSAGETDFWSHIMKLVDVGYRLQ